MFDSRKPSKFKFEESFKLSNSSKIDLIPENPKDVQFRNYLREESNVIKEETPENSDQAQFFFQNTISGKMKNAKPFKIGLVKNNTSLNNSRRRWASNGSEDHKTEQINLRSEFEGE